MAVRRARCGEACAASGEKGEKGEKGEG